MRRLELPAFPLALALLAWACGGKSRPDSSHAPHTFDAQVCQHPPSEAF